jgi:hypothetical protein
MTDNIFFKSPAHRERLVEAIERLEKIEESNGKADSWYVAALYILTADHATWDDVQPYVSSTGIKFDDILANIHFSSGYATMIEVAANLFRDSGQVDLSRFTNLDESNFQIVIDAIRLRRYSIGMDELKGE